MIGCNRSIWFSIEARKRFRGKKELPKSTEQSKRTCCSVMTAAKRRGVHIAGVLAHPCADEKIGGDVNIPWFHVVVAVGGLLVWAVLHLVVPFLLGALVARRWPGLARFLPHAGAGNHPHPPAVPPTPVPAQTFAAFQAQRAVRPLVSAEPDREAMRARYDEAIYAHLEGRELTEAQQRIVQFHYHGEGCAPCAALRGA